MKTEIKTKVKNVLEAHRNAISAYLAEIDQWNKNTIYSDVYKKEQINEIKQQMTSVDTIFNQKLKEIVAEEKSALIGAPIEKPSDYQMQVANALEFIKLAGKTLTDKQAVEILEPFKHDLKTMDLFKQVVDNMLPDNKGVAAAMKYPFQKTFGKVSDYTLMVNNLDAVDSMVNDLFDSKQDSTMALGLKMSFFMGNVDAIHELAQGIEETEGVK